MSKRDIIKEIKNDLEGEANYISFKYETVKEIYDILKEQEETIDKLLFQIGKQARMLTCK